MIQGGLKNSDQFGWTGILSISKETWFLPPQVFFEGWCHMWCQTCLDMFWFRIVFSREDSQYRQSLCTVTTDYFAHLVFCWKCMYFQQKGKWNFCCCIWITSDALLIYTLSDWTRRDLTCHCSSCNSDTSFI